MILLFEEYQYTNADDIALIKQCVGQAYLRNYRLTSLF